MLDWQDVIDKSHLLDTFELSPDTQAVVLACLVSFLGRYEWMYDGDDPTDAEWDTIEAGLSQAINEMTIPYTCPSGGGNDYNLISDIELSTDATTYDLADLDLIAGTDLIIDLMLAAKDTSQRTLRYQVSGLTTAIYTYSEALFGTTSTTWQGATTTYGQIARGLLKGETPQNRYSWSQLNLPDWKATDRYKTIHVNSIIDGRHSKSRVVVADTGAIDSLLLYSATGDIKLGSKIRIWARG